MIIQWKQNKFYFNFLTTVILLSSVVTSEIYADDIKASAANTGFQLLENPVNPRFIAMGSAGTASSGSGFSYYNPALPFLIGTSYLSAEYGQYPKADLKRTHLEGVVFLEEWFFGITFHTESIENIFPVNIWGNLPGYDKPFSQQFTNISLNCGFSKWEDFAFAVSFNAMQDRIEDEYAYAFTVSTGAVFIPIPGHLTVGLSLLNYGTSTPMLGSDNKKSIGDGEDIPMNSRLGITWIHSIKEIPYTFALDVVYRNVLDRDKSFKRNIRDRFTVPIGLEVKPLAPLAIRIGKRFNLSTEIINFGLGVNLDLLHVDLSFVIPRLIDDNQIKWLTAVTYYLRKKKDQGHTGTQNQQKKADTSQSVIKAEPVTEHDTPEEIIDTSRSKSEITDDFEDKKDSLQETPVNLTPLDSVQIDSVSVDSTTEVIESKEIILESVDYIAPKDTLGTADSISVQMDDQDSLGLNTNEEIEILFQGNDSEKD
ncbi:MAG: hypothetical protein PVI26_02195 [Chitinispirillia bacterium]|jgi:hypothetical protein